MEVLFSNELKDMLHCRYVISDLDRLEALQSNTARPPHAN